MFSALQQVDVRVAWTEHSGRGVFPGKRHASELTPYASGVKCRAIKRLRMKVMSRLATWEAARTKERSPSRRERCPCQRVAYKSALPLELADGQ